MISLSKRRAEINKDVISFVYKAVSKLGSKRKAAKEFGTSASNVGRWLKGVAITDAMLQKISPQLYDRILEVKAEVLDLVIYCRLMFGSNVEFANELQISSVTTFTWLRGSRFPCDEHIIKMEALAAAIDENLRVIHRGGSHGG